MPALGGLLAAAGAAASAKASATSGEIAAPFLVAMALQLISWLLTYLIPFRVPQLLAKVQNPGKRRTADAVYVSDIAAWSVDLAGSVGAVVAPVAGLVLVAPGTDDAARLSIIYAACLVAAIGLFVYIFTRSDASYYLRRLKFVPFSPGVLVGLLVNGGALVVALRPWS